MHLFIKKDGANEIFDSIQEQFKLNGTKNDKTAQGGGTYQEGIVEHLTKIVEAW